MTLDTATTENPSYSSTLPKATQAALFQLLKEFRKLEEEQRDLDYRRSLWCRKARDTFAGDKQFIEWCKCDLGMTEYQAQELIQRAAAIKAVPDSQTYNTLGGFAKVRSVLSLSRKEQVATIEAAKVECLSLNTVMRRRAGAMQPERTKSVAPKTSINADITQLATYLHKHSKGKVLPSEIRVIVDMYKSRE